MSRANSQQELIEYFKKSNEPLSDSSLISFYKLNKFASKKVKVVLGGDAADELFGGYDTLKAIKKFGVTKHHRKNFNPIHNILSSK